MLALLPAQPAAASPHKPPSFVENNSNKNGKTTPEPPLQDPSPTFLCSSPQATSKAWINRAGHDKTSKPPSPDNERHRERQRIQHGAAGTASTARLSARGDPGSPARSPAGTRSPASFQPAAPQRRAAPSPAHGDVTELHGLRLAPHAEFHPAALRDASRLSPGLQAAQGDAERSEPRPPGTFLGALVTVAMKENFSASSASLACFASSPPAGSGTDIVRRGGAEGGEGKGRLGSTRLGSARLSSVRFGSVRLGSARSAPVRSALRRTLRAPREAPGASLP